MEIIKILPVKSDQRTTLDNHFHASEPVKGDHPKILATDKTRKTEFLDWSREKSRNNQGAHKERKYNTSVHSVELWNNWAQYLVVA
jgi:hypothetical protein